MTQNHHLGDARYKKLLALLTQVLGDAGSATVHWANDLATSTNLHQWVSGISGQNGTGAMCALRSGVTILQTQGGTPAAPVTEQPLIVQPLANPDATANGPFGQWLQSVINAPSGLKSDCVLHVGYNYAGGPDVDLGEPMSVVSFENDFEYAPGQYQMETHHQYAPAGGAFVVRPYSSSFERATGRVQAGSQTRDAVAGDGSGSYAVAEQQTNSTRMLLATDSSSFIRLSAPNVAAQGLASAVRLDSGGKATGIAAYSHAGGNPLVLAYADALDGVHYGDTTSPILTQTVGGGGTIKWFFNADETDVTRDQILFASAALQAQIAMAPASPAANPAAVILKPQIPGVGAVTVGQKTPGNCLVALTDPPAGGNIPEFRVEESGTVYAILSRQLNGSAFGALYLGIDPPAGDPGGVAAILSDGANTYCNAPTTNLNLSIATSVKVQVQAAGMFPNNDNGQMLGSNGKRWSEIHGVAMIGATGTIGGETFPSNNVALTYATSGPLSAAASFALSAAQIGTPVIQLTGIVPGGGTTITLPNNPGATWYFDLTGVTLTGGLTFSTGAGTTATIGAADIAGGRKLVTIVVVANNFVAAG